MRTNAKRSCGSLLRIDVTSRLSTSLKLPSKSPSILPVSVRFFEMSGHSRLSPKRVDRALMWTSGSCVGPVLKMFPEFSHMPGNGKSSPSGSLLSWTTVDLMKPYGASVIGPAFMPAKPPGFGASTGNTRTGVTAVITAGGVCGSSPATRDGIGCPGPGWVCCCGEDSEMVSLDDEEEDIVSFSDAGAAATAAGCGAGFAATDKSAALKTPLRLSASTRA